MSRKVKTDSGALNIALIQMTCSTEPRENLDKALKRIKEAAKQGAQIVCLQELFRSRYFCQSEDDSQFALAESIPGPTTEALSKAAAAAKIVLVGSIFERRAEGLYHNTAVVFDSDGKMTGKYRKMHIPDDPCYYEKFYFTPGDAQPGFRAIETAHGKIGTLVCWDQWFPEAARLTALAGARVLFYPTAIGWHPKDDPETKKAQADAWELIQRAHALANGCFVCAVNRVGREDNLDFWGGSFVADPFGRVIAKASADKEEILLARCELSSIDWTRRHWPFLRDRRVDAYGGVLQRFLD
ncbi:MAG TPA: carbon-nitrogen hydrolase [Planctomycetota bacterium]|nr:carbon-nitrogen hydrolase [Planctomycetota bacterium]